MRYSLNRGTDTGGCVSADTINLTVDVGLPTVLPQLTGAITIAGDGHTVSRTSGKLRILDVTVGGAVSLNQAPLSGGSYTFDVSSQ